MKVTKSHLSLLVGSCALLASALPAACVDNVETAIKSCPCATGNICCDSGVCASDQAACGAATLALSQSVEGEWTGYVENFRADAEDAVTVAISVAGDGTLSGHVTFGVGQPPPPATDPALPWPAGFPQIQTSWIPGVAYEARDISWQERRLKLRIVTYEPWQPWCALQQSYPGYPDGYSCVPFGLEGDANGCWVPGVLPTDPKIEVNCEKASLCFEMCRCDANSCNAVDDVFYSLDVAFDGRRADGSINVWNANYNLRLTR